MRFQNSLTVFQPPDLIRQMAQGLFTARSNRLKFQFLKELPGRLLPPKTERPLQLVTYLNRSSYAPQRQLYYYDTQVTLLQAVCQRNTTFSRHLSKSTTTDSLLATAFHHNRRLRLPFSFQSFPVETSGRHRLEQMLLAATFSTLAPGSSSPQGGIGKYIPPIGHPATDRHLNKRSHFYRSSFESAIYILRSRYRPQFEFRPKPLR
jgi:hypothetical protein